MKKILILIILTFVISTPVLADKKKDDIVISVKGMACDFCAQSLIKMFKKEDGVNNLTIDLDKQTVIVDTTKEAHLSDEKIKELVEWSGYDFVSVQRN